MCTAALPTGKETKQLPVIRKDTTCYRFLEVLLKEIECCPGLFSQQPLTEGVKCSHCGQPGKPLKTTLVVCATDVLPAKSSKSNGRK